MTGVLAASLILNVAFFLGAVYYWAEGAFAENKQLRQQRKRDRYMSGHAKEILALMKEDPQGWERDPQKEWWTYIGRPVIDGSLLSEHAKALIKEAQQHLLIQEAKRNWVDKELDEL